MPRAVSTKQSTRLAPPNLLPVSLDELQPFLEPIHLFEELI